MKVRIIQPPYTFNPDDLQVNYDKMVALMDECDEPLDIIVMPEYCDIPAAQKGKTAYRAAIDQRPERQNYYLAAARLAYTNQRWITAVQIMDHAVAHDPENRTTSTRATPRHGS